MAYLKYAGAAWRRKVHSTLIAWGFWVACGIYFAANLFMIFRKDKEKRDNEKS